MTDSTRQPNLAKTWAIVLAASDTRRLLAVTSGGEGTAVPKQFCSRWGEQTPLQEALSRAGALVARERLCAVVGAAYREWWKPQLWAVRASNTAVQPVDRGTGVGVLQALLQIMRRDPGARVLLLPCERYVARDAVFEHALRQALAHVTAQPASAVLLGFRAESDDPGIGYVLPGEHTHGDLRDVVDLVDKTTAARASDLVRRGALWSSSIVAASAAALLELYQRRHGGVVSAVRQYVEQRDDPFFDAESAAADYARLPTLDLVRDVLRGQESALQVLPVPACGWSDLGTPWVRGGGHVSPPVAPAWRGSLPGLVRHQPQPQPQR